MGFLNFKSRDQSKVEVITDMLPRVADVDIIFVAKGDKLIYTKKDCDHLFALDDDGDQKLNGRVASIVFRGQTDKSVIEVFVAISEEESYGLFTLQLGLQERLAFISESIFKQLGSRQNLFGSTDTYATQFVYTFKMYNSTSLLGTT